MCLFTLPSLCAMCCMESVAQFSVVLLHSHIVLLQEKRFISSKAEVCTFTDGVIPALPKA